MKSFRLLNSDAVFLTEIPIRLSGPMVLADNGCACEDIAADLCLPIGTVKSRIFRARERILKLRKGGA